MKMNKNNPFYSFMKDLPVNEDGSFNYDIKKRMLNKYKKKIRLTMLKQRPVSFVNQEKKEVA